MGLDMYLTGTIYTMTFPRKRGERKAELFDLGYWRKHPNLHGYIVQAFAEGKDECQEIPLNDEDIRQIMQAVKDKALPYTTGFFFGGSEGTAAERKEDLDIFQGAIDWLATEEKDTIRSVSYRASW
jgi:adenylate cyclase